MRTGIAMGSNVGDRLETLVRARDAVLALEGVSGPCLCSSLYETEPVGTEPDTWRFINAVIEVEYNGLPASLLEGLQQIEAAMGRPSKRPRNAPRTIDLDILYVGNLTLSTTAIVIPHPRLHLRRFVLEPLVEIRPGLLLPGQQMTAGELLETLADPFAVELFHHQWPSLT
jgi:2-amino-4-hydroxy-6-hydroxymethyldihydropteridine diphosphokinase